MKVRELMVRDVKTCREDDDLECPARTMWEADCGTVPVVDSGGRVTGMITDRDVCMAAYTKGLPLKAIRVRDAMATQVASVGPDDGLEDAMGVMREARVRRVPVLDGRGSLVGILSMNDLARQARRELDEGGPGRRPAIATELTGTLGVISEPGNDPAADGRSRERPLARVR